MKKAIDIKSLIIGILVTALVFTIIGARGKNSANFDTITAKAIRIVNQKGKVAAILASNSEGNGLEIRNGKGKIMADLFNHPLGTDLFVYTEEGKPSVRLGSLLGGYLKIYNREGKIVVQLEGVWEEGSIYVFNKKGESVAKLSSVNGEGGLCVKGGVYIENQHGKPVVALAPTEDGDGAIALFDRYGDFGWGMKGKR